MKTVQKVLVSLLLATVVFTAFAIAAYSGLFSIIDSRFYNQRVRTTAQEFLGQAADGVSDYLRSLRQDVGSLASEAAIGNSFLINQSREDIEDRAVAVGRLLELRPEIDYLRIIDNERGRLWFSTLDDDIALRSPTRVEYRAVSELEPPILLPDQQEEGTGSDWIPERGALRITVPVADSFDIPRGTLVAWVGTSGIYNSLVRGGIIGPSQRVRLTPAGTLVVNAPRHLEGEDLSELDEALTEPESTPVVDSSIGVSYAIEFREADPQLPPLAYMINEDDLHMDRPLQIILLASVFLLTFIIVYLVLNIRQDPTVVVAERFRRFQESVVRDYLREGRAIDPELWQRELGNRRERIEKEIQRGLGRVSDETREALEQNMQRNWDELYRLIGTREGAGQRTELEPVSLRQIEEIIERTLARYGEAGPRPASAPRRQAQPVPVEDVPDADTTDDSTATAAPQPVAVEDVDELDDAEELDELDELEDAEELGDLEDADAVEEAEDVAELDELEDAEELGDLEDADAVEEAEDVAELDELEEMEEVEAADGPAEAAEPQPVAVEDVDELDDAEELDELEDAEELGDLEDADAVEEAEDVAELDELEEMEEVEAADGPAEAAAPQPVAVEDVDELDDAEELDELDELEDAEDLGDLEDADVVEEAEDVAELDELEDAEELGDLEDADAVEEAEDVAELDELEDAAELSDLEDADAVEEAEDVAELDELEDAAELSDLEDADVVEEADEVAELDGLEDAEELGDLEDADVVEEAEDVAELDELEEMEEVEPADGPVESAVEDVAELDDVEELDELDELEDAEELEEAEDLEEVEAFNDTEEAAEPAELGEFEEMEAVEPADGPVEPTEAADLQPVGDADSDDFDDVIGEIVVEEPDNVLVPEVDQNDLSGGEDLESSGDTGYRGEADADDEDALTVEVDGDEADGLSADLEEVEDAEELVEATDEPIALESAEAEQSGAESERRAPPAGGTPDWLSVSATALELAEDDDPFPKMSSKVSDTSIGDDTDEELEDLAADDALIPVELEDDPEPQTSLATEPETYDQTAEELEPAEELLEPSDDLEPAELEPVTASDDEPIEVLEPALDEDDPDEELEPVEELDPDAEDMDEAEPEEAEELSAAVSPFLMNYGSFGADSGMVDWRGTPAASARPAVYRADELSQGTVAIRDLENTDTHHVAEIDDFVAFAGRNISVIDERDGLARITAAAYFTESRDVDQRLRTLADQVVSREATASIDDVFGSAFADIDFGDILGSGGAGQQTEQPDSADTSLRVVAGGFQLPSIASPGDAGVRQTYRQLVRITRRWDARVAVIMESREDGRMVGSFGLGMPDACSGPLVVEASSDLSRIIARYRRVALLKRPLSAFRDFSGTCHAQKFTGINSWLLLPLETRGAVQYLMVGFSRNYDDLVDLTLQHEIVPRAV